MQRTGGIALAALLLVLMTSCAELPGGEADSSAALQQLQLPDTRSVPAGWGDLVAVSNSSKFPDVFQLWFQNEAGEIHLVVFDNASRSLLTTSRVITRR